MDRLTQSCWIGNRGPLTTIFTPASTCLATTSVWIAGYLAPPAEQITVYYVGLWRGAFPGRVTTYASDACVPPAVLPIYSLRPGYYSPGMCPSAYTPAATLSTAQQCGFDVAVPASITAWLCCPSGYSQATAIRSNGWIASTNCVSTAAGPRTLTSVWPASWVSAAEDFASISTWPIIPPSGIIQPSVVINDPTVMAEGISIMWESTDTQIQSWFNHYGGSGSPKTTGSVPTHLTTAAPSPTQSVTTPTATNVQSSRAWERGRGNKLYMAVLGAALLVCTSLTL